MLRDGVVVQLFAVSTSSHHWLATAAQPSAAYAAAASWKLSAAAFQP